MRIILIIGNLCFSPRSHAMRLGALVANLHHMIITIITRNATNTILYNAANITQLVGFGPICFKNMTRCQRFQVDICILDMICLSYPHSIFWDASNIVYRPEQWDRTFRLQCKRHNYHHHCTDLVARLTHTSWAIRSALSSHWLPKKTKKFCRRS